MGGEEVVELLAELLRLAGDALGALLGRPRPAPDAGGQLLQRRDEPPRSILRRRAQQLRRLTTKLDLRHQPLRCLPLRLLLLSLLPLTLLVLRLAVLLGSEVAGDGAMEKPGLASRNQ